MPIYDYTCSACRRVTEVIHGINDHGPTFCPECGAKGTMTKAFVAPTVHYKGTGWAKKDRGTSARSARTKDEKGTSSGEGSTAATGSGSSTESTKTDTTTPDAGSSGGSSSGSSSTGGSSTSSGSSD